MAIYCNNVFANDWAFCDTMNVASTDREWLQRSIEICKSWNVLETVISDTKKERKKTKDLCRSGG